MSQWRGVRDALKKTDLRTLSQKEGGCPDQIPKFDAFEIGTWGRGSSEKLICPIFKSDSRTKGEFWRVVPLQVITWCYPSVIGTNQKVKSFAIQSKSFYYVPNFDRWEGVRSQNQMSQLLMSQSGYGGGGEVSGLIGTLSLNPFLWGIEGPPRIFQNLVLVEESVKIWVFDCPEPSLDILK